MRRLSGWLCLCVLASVASCGDGTGASPGLPVIVGFSGSVDPAVFTNHGGTLKSVNTDLSTLAGSLPAENVPALQAEPAVRFVEEDLVVHVGRLEAPAAPAAESVPWGVLHIAADYCWGISDGSYTDGSPVRVAILDTGIDTCSPAAPNATHEDLVGQAVFGINQTNTHFDTDRDGHGTHVAGTVAAKRGNNLGVVGVAPKALCVAVKVLNDQGTGAYSDIIDGITWAANNSCKVINMSFGGYGNSPALEAAVDYAWGQGVVMATAAGNDNVQTLHYPSAYTNCIAVVATTQTDARASFSNYGSWTDISAPGVSILSCQKNNTYEAWNGTSMASPHVAGVVALLWAEYPTKSASWIRQRLQDNSAGPIGGGSIPNLVDPYKALVSPTPAP